MRYHTMGFDGSLSGGLAGPLVGGGVTQVGTLATKLIFGKSSPKLDKWAPTVGLALGALVSGILAARRSTRAIGIAGLVTAGLVAIPRQLEELMMGANVKGFGVITPEQMQGAFGEQAPVELLDSGNGNYSGMGVTTAEQGMGQPGPVEMLGNSGFGANFASVGR